MSTTVVVTGASAGIGRAVARGFAGRGACVALLARGEAGLAGAARDIELAGGRALPIPVDVADAAAVDEAASAVEREVGPIDVWVNSAFASVFAPFDEITPEEFRRVTEVTYLGFVHGTRAALDRMKPRDTGVIVQVGSALGLRSVPLQSAYCGAKHAINGFTSSLQVELRHDRSGVAVTVVQIPAVNTPQFSWVRSRLPRRPQPVPPIYQPEVAARAVLFAADHPRRKQYRVGTSTVATVLGEKLASPLLDRYLARTGYAAQQTDRPRDPGQRDNLWAPVDDGTGATEAADAADTADNTDTAGPECGDHGAHGDFDARSRTRDPQLWWSRHRGLVTATLAGAGAGAVALTAGLRTRARSRGAHPARPAGPARPSRCLR